MINENTRENYGKILFAISALIFITMLLSPLTNSLYHMDEYFTLAIIKLPIMQAITVTAHDVHPPLYYLILLLVIKLVSPFNPDLVFISKIVTIIPYFLILIVSATRIRKEYGWLTAGLLAFALSVMSNFYITYLTIRMYSWAILFLLLSFICLKDVLVKHDFKSWFLFTAFTLLGAYTHYFDAISSIILYVMILIYYIMNNRSEIRNWFISTVLLIVGYVPWVMILFSQLEMVHKGYWIPQVTVDYIIQCISYYATSSTNEILFALSIIFLIISFAVFIMGISDRDKLDNNYLLMGMLLFLLTILVTTLVSYLFKPILIDRYLLPAIALFWLALSIIIGELEEKRLLIISLVLIMVLGISGIAVAFDSTITAHNQAVLDEKYLDGINSNDSTVICIGPGELLPLGTYLNDSMVIMDTDDAYGVSHEDLSSLFNIYHVNDFNKTVEKAKGHVHVIMGSWNENRLVENIKPDYRIGDNFFYRIS